MGEVFVVSDNIHSPLGFTTTANYNQLLNGVSGLKIHADQNISSTPFCASLFEKNFPEVPGLDPEVYTKFEQLLVSSIQGALTGCSLNCYDEKLILIISTTKGNISLLEHHSISPELKNRISINSSAAKISAYFGFRNKPIVVSNACISGLLAILVGKRLIGSGQYQHAVIAGADLITKFILSGFESFQAMSSLPCKPFDLDRNGINLGEAAATMILSSDRSLSKSGIRISGGSVSNDANHISGPSRTGEELNQAIQRAMQEANLKAGDLDCISVHGTATIYNDEMEAKALALSNLNEIPLTSLKGYFGHTLCAAGLLESIIAVRAMSANQLLPTAGYKRPGVSVPVNVISSLKSAELKHCLKTASGFGGCNAAMVFSKS